MKYSIFILVVIFACNIYSQNIGINNIDPQSSLDVKGDVVFRVDTLEMVNGINDNIDITSSKSMNYVLNGPNTTFELGGFNGGIDGRIIILYNSSPAAYYIKHYAAGTNPINQINTGTGADITMNSYSTVILQYLALDSLWHIVSTFNELSAMSSGMEWTTLGNDIYNNNIGNVGIGTTSPIKAKLEVAGVAGSGNTSAIFGTDGRGLSFQKDWPTIGFNQYRDGPTGWGKAIGSGYGMHMYLDPYHGSFQFDMQDSVGADQPFAIQPKRSLTLFKNGFVHIGDNNVGSSATLSISGSSNYPSHFNYGSGGHTYIRGGNISKWTPFSLFPSKVYINDIPGVNLITGTQTAGGDVIIATGGGKVGIGIETLTHRLEVNGTIRSKEILVEASPWPDYVFAKDYKLPKLKDLEQFIVTHKHLPNIPAAKEIESNGQAVGEIQRKMMEKIEELTLYIINLEKRISQLENN